jgi:hypothetical protein
MPYWLTDKQDVVSKVKDVDLATVTCARRRRQTMTERNKINENFNGNR